MSPRSVWVYVSRPTAVGGGEFYYTPGPRVSAGYRATGYQDLYKLVGDVSSLIWTTAWNEYILSLCYSTVTGRTYVCTDGGSGSCVYEIAADDTVSVVSDTAATIGAYHAAEFGGALYLATPTVAGVWPTVYQGTVERYVPLTGERTTVFMTTGAVAAGSLFDAYGGIGCDGTTLYYSDGVAVYSSTDGVNWSLFWDGLAAGVACLSDFASNETAKTVLFSARVISGDDRPCYIYQIVDGVLGLAATAGSVLKDGETETPGFGAVCFMSTGTQESPSQSYAYACTYYAVVNSTNTIVMPLTLASNVLDWVDIGTVPAEVGNYGCSGCHPISSSGGVLYALFESAVIADMYGYDDHRWVTLAKYASGTWTAITTHDWTGNWLSGVLATNTGLKTHEV